jgi:hypothetical protein
MILIFFKKIGYTITGKMNSLIEKPSDLKSATLATAI